MKIGPDNSITTDKLQISSYTEDDHTEILIQNRKTGKFSRYRLDISEQGSTYHLLLQTFQDGRWKGIHGVRELIDNIGDEK